MELELRDYFRVLQKRRWVVAIALAACLAGAAAATALSTPVYQARTKLFVGQAQVESTDISTGVQTGILIQQLLKSYAHVVRLRPTAERAIEAENLPVSPTTLAGRLRADPILDTRLIEVSYQSPDPALAQRIVNAVSAAFVEEIERIETPRSEGAEPAVKVSIVEPALLPSAPVRPQPVRNMALAFVLGAMLGVGLAFLFEYLDTSIRTPEDVEELLDTPVLAVIPRLENETREVLLTKDSQSMAAESFRKLRTAVQFLAVDAPVRAIVVTSPLAEDGKTTTAINLATAFAQAGLRTVLVEGDLRRPSLHKVFPSDGQKGLTTVLIGRHTLEQALLPTPIRNLRHMPAGAVPPNPAELLSSAQMAELLTELRNQADMIVIDCPPLLPVADAAVLAPRVDGVLMVAKSGNTHRDRLEEAVRIVGKVGGRMLGVLLNYVGRRDGGYGYYDYSTYAYRRTSAVFESRREVPPAGQPVRPGVGGGPGDGVRAAGEPGPSRVSSGQPPTPGPRPRRISTDNDLQPRPPVQAPRAPASPDSSPVPDQPPAQAPAERPAGVDPGNTADPRTVVGNGTPPPPRRPAASGPASEQVGAVQQAAQESEEAVRQPRGG